ncbi:MAG: hypothetical protein M1838_002099 [Thelocarpon superellum]|nr:MAG: hypothetical protein M1838_002099 [Thelocarpon superellum]
MGFACGFQCLLTLLQHSRIRSKYNIEGSAGDDCVHAVCCLPCTLIQDEREVRDREDDMRKFAGPGAGVGGPMAYSRSPTMTYSPQ